LNKAERLARNREEREARSEALSALRRQSKRSMTPPQVKRVVAMSTDGKTQTFIATEFGVTPDLISRILTGKTYRSITGIKKARTVGRPTARAIKMIPLLSAEGQKSIALAKRFRISVRDCRDIIHGRY